VELVVGLPAKSYFIVVDEYDHVASSYKLFVNQESEGIPAKSVRTLNSDLKNVDIKNKKTDAKWLEYND